MKKIHNSSFPITILTAALGAVTFMLYIPLVSFLASMAHFPFGLDEFLPALVWPFLVVFVVLIILLLIAQSPKTTKKTKDGKEAGVDGFIKSITPLHIIIVLLVLCIWIEGSFLNRGLPQLTGAKDLFTSQPRLILDTIVWVFVFILGLILHKQIKKHYRYILIALTVFLVLGLGDAFLSRESVDENTLRVTNLEVLNEATFGQEDNILVMVLDAMSTALIKDYLDAKPEAYNSMSGFTVFENNMETATSTQWSLPSILKGDIYSGGSVQNYQGDAFTADSSMVQSFSQAGYDIYCSSTLPAFNTILTKNSTGGSSLKVRLNPEVYGQLILRFTPYGFKNILANNISYDSNSALVSSDDGGNLSAVEREDAYYDEKAYLALLNGISEKKSEVPTFNFHHVQGAHMPYTIDSTGQELPATESHTYFGLQEQTAWTMGYVERLLESLKQNNLYDSTTIVFLGDHGDRLSVSDRTNKAYANHASLFIKPAGAKGPLTFSPAGTSNMYLSNILSGLVLKEASLTTLTTGLPAERQLFYPGSSILKTYSGQDVTNLKEVDSVSVVQEMTPTTLEKGIKYGLTPLVDTGLPQAVPAAVEGGNFYNGWGIKLEDQTSTLAFNLKAKMGDNIGATLTLRTGAAGGGEIAFTPYKLTVTDSTSGEISVFDIREYNTTLEFNNLQITDTNQLVLEFQMDAVDKKLNYLITDITIN